MVLLFIVLACTLIKLYVEKETNLIETLKNGLEKNIDIYNQRTMNDTGNILSFSLDHIIVFRDRQKFVFSLKEFNEKFCNFLKDKIVKFSVCTFRAENV